ncbi:hypothetical protein AGLY_002011 [Aphis glycines]|uniref:THAP-type domain-containing protein n=1 Tax=Aphis glycines TaxID=307491 RepID=A0A6G0U3T4_APHGL|nr:hypothetical protein AGLY_002011 [Aphis glycines]
MVLLCIVKNCVNSKMKLKQRNCPLHKFPNDISRCNQWLTNSKLFDLRGKSKNYRICGRHFNANSYSNPKKKKLLPTAIPTEFDFTEPDIEQPLVDSVEVSIEDDTSLVEPRYSNTPSKSDVLESSTSTQSAQLLSVNTPRKSLLKTKVNELEKKCRMLEGNVNLMSNKFLQVMTSKDHFYEVCDIHLPPNPSMIVKSYCRIASRHPQGFRYTNQLKQLALTIYFYGLMAYRFLKNILQLPSPRTLRIITEKLD